MTSAAALPISSLRSPLLRWAPILLPLLPFFGLAHNEVTPEAILGALGLLGVGAVLGLALPDLLARAGWHRRKEAEQIRPAWVASLFVAQVPMLAGQNSDEMPLALLFACTCALIASMAFGAEFHQRTLAGLLAQPVDRRSLWSGKMLVLGAALALHLGIFGLSLVAAGMAPREGLPAFGLGVVGAVLAWTTVPGWTLLTRSVVAGLVFSVPVPLVLMALASTLADLAERHLPDETAAGASRMILAVAFCGLGPVYALGACWLGRRRWIHLENPDATGEQGGGIFLGRWGATRSGSELRARSGFRWLLGKELRLQTVTLATWAAMFLFLALRAALSLSVTSREYLGLLIILFGVTTLLLAGATPLAEERRLGTLDGQVLLPFARSRQWGIKLLLALVLGLTPLLALVPLDRGNLIDRGLFVVLLLAIHAFFFCLLASSGTASALRALLLGLGFTAAAAAVAGALGATADLVIKPWVDQVYRSGIEEPELWFARARSLDAATAEIFRQRALPPSTVLLVLLVSVPALLPILPAAAFAGRNFARPAAAPHLLHRQALACLATLLVLGTLTLTAFARFAHRQATAFNLSRAWKADQFHRRLTPGDKALHALRFGPSTAGFYDATPLVVVRLRKPVEGSAPSAPAVEWESRGFRLPLEATNRARIIADADIPEPLRDLLRRDAAAAGDTNAAAGSGRPPGPWPAPVGVIHAEGTFVMSPELMKRYGLIPPAAAPAPSTSPAAGTSAPPPAAGTPTFQMSPELMKRYGLIPTTPAPASGASPAEAEAAKPSPPQAP